MKVSTNSLHKKYIIWTLGSATFYDTEMEALTRYAEDKTKGHVPSLFVNIQVEPASGYKIVE